jgi:hypothetical protein
MAGNLDRPRLKWEAAASMRGGSWVTRWPLALALALRAPLAAPLGAALLSGCIPTAQSLPDGAASLPCLGPSCVPQDTGATVTEAPLVDCTAAEQGVEFAPFSVLDNETGTAQYFYQYVDGTSGLQPSGYSPPALAQDRCLGAKPGNFVMHESGGPFVGWGGGIGIGLEHLNQDAGLCTSPTSPFCPLGGGSTTTTPCYCPPLGTGAAGQAINFAALDVSQYDGISFWARRGPNGQPLLRVLVGDKYTDDDISYLMSVGDPTEPRFCERKGECSCLFQNASCDFYPANLPVVPSDVDGGGYYCGPPGSLPGSASQSGGGSVGNPTGAATNRCNVTLCDAPYSAFPNNGPDPTFGGRACTPYVYRNGTEVNLCYNPGKDPLPPEPDQQCGDHFAFPVNLSTEWKFYMIPFTEMSQQGWAKQARAFDLTSASVVRFTWDVGYIDYYIDNIRFYRNSRSQ